MKIVTQKYKMPENCHECHLFDKGKELKDGWREVETGTPFSGVVKQQFRPDIYEGICSLVFKKFMTTEDVKNRRWKPGLYEPCDYKILIESSEIIK